MDSEDECYESGMGSHYDCRVVEQQVEMKRGEVHGHSQGSDYGHLDVPAYPKGIAVSRRAPYEVPVRQRCGPGYSGSQGNVPSMDASSHSMSSRKETTI